MLEKRQFGILMLANILYGRKILQVNVHLNITISRQEMGQKFLFFFFIFDRHDWWIMLILMTSKTIFMNCMIIGLFHFSALFIGLYTAYDWYLEKDHLKLKKTNNWNNHFGHVVTKSTYLTDESTWTHHNCLYGLRR